MFILYKYEIIFIINVYNMYIEYDIEKDQNIVKIYIFIK